jgi:4-diphosphocytidyl-2-C-methyl-D-erythritol kinase
VAHDPARPMVVRAPAKINLTLDVLGRRADGYHELASVMQTIGLHDTLVLHPAPEGQVSLTCDVPELANSDNLALRAAHLIRQATDCARGVRIDLLKAIPLQGGLGGGSSDGAAVLVALNRWWDLGLSQEALIDLAARLGSDVPFFIVGGSARVGGRGEVVTPLVDLPPLWLAVAKPPVSIPTPAVFRTLTPADFTDGTATDSLIAHIQAGTLPPLTNAALPNALEPGVLRDYPAVAATRDQLLAAGAPCVRMSGSGPTLYAPFIDLAAAATVYHAAQAAGMQVWLTPTMPRET